MSLRIAQLRRQDKQQLASLLECHACGGIWTPHRLLHAGYTYDDADLPAVMCRLCGDTVDSVEHRTYNCQATQEVLERQLAGDKHHGPWAKGHVRRALRDLS